MTKEKDIVRKVKVIRSERMIDKYDVYYSRSVFYPAAGDWEEMSNEEYLELQDAVRYANSQTKEGYYFLIEYNEKTMEEVFRDANDFKEKMRKAQERDKKRKEEEQRKKEERAQERKRKQLEKLKRELGET